MNKIYLFTLLISFNTLAKELYFLPHDIVIARDKLLASKQKLDDDIVRSYFNLCQKNVHNEAEHIEFLAYQEITGMQCWHLLIK